MNRLWVCEVPAATHFGAPNKYGDGSYYAIAYQPDGKIVAAGRGTISNVNVDDFVIDRKGDVHFPHNTCARKACQLVERGQL